MSQACGALLAQTREKGQVRVHRRVGSVRVHRVHGLILAGLPTTPTCLLVDNGDGCSDHFDNPG
jgi:hypothetical protein